MQRQEVSKRDRNGEIGNGTATQEDPTRNGPELEVRPHTPVRDAHG